MLFSEPLVVHESVESPSLVQTVCEVPARPAGYPQEFFADTIEEAIDFIKDGRRTFVFVPQSPCTQQGVALPKPMPLPPYAGSKRYRYLEYAILSTHNGYTELSNHTQLDGFGKFIDRYDGYNNPSFWDYVGNPPRSPGNIQSNVSNLVNFFELYARMNGYKQNIAPFIEVFYDQIHPTLTKIGSVNIKVVPFFQGTKVLPFTPYWHIDTPGVVLDPSVSLGVNILNVMQGPKPFYCDHSLSEEEARKFEIMLDNHQDDYHFKYTNSKERAPDSRNVSTCELSEKVCFPRGGYTDELVKKDVLDVLLSSLKVAGQPLGAYLDHHPNPMIREILERWIDEEILAESAIVEELESPLTQEKLDAAQELASFSKCTENGGTVWQAPANYLSVHAISNQPSVAAFHRSPLSVKNEATAEIEDRWGFAFLLPLSYKEAGGE